MKVRNFESTSSSINTSLSTGSLYTLLIDFKSSSSSTPFNIKDVFSYWVLNFNFVVCPWCISTPILLSQVTLGFSAVNTWTYANRNIRTLYSISSCWSVFITMYIYIFANYLTLIFPTKHIKDLASRFTLFANDIVQLRESKKDLNEVEDLETNLRNIWVFPK